MTLREVSERLKVSYDSVRQSASRMRRKGLSTRCPECFSPSFFRLVCHSCGLDATQTGPVQWSVDFSSQNPVYLLQPSGSLGSATSYSALGLQYGGKNISHLVERPENPMFERLRSRLWQGLKSKMPRDDVCEDAVKMLKAEYIGAQLHYPEITRWRGFGDAVLARVWSRLVLLYPGLPNELPVVPKSRMQKSDRVTGSIDPPSPVFDDEHA
jgi:hypothetical protein